MLSRRRRLAEHLLLLGLLRELFCGDRLGRPVLSALPLGLPGPLPKLLEGLLGEAAQRDLLHLLLAGQDHDVRAVWVNVPSLEVQAAHQRYTRMGDTIYLYENLKSGYSNEITADEPWLVTLCPAAFERLA